MLTYRAMLYWEKEKGFQGFDTTYGADIRRGWSEEAAAYIRANSPAKYRDFLVPKTEIGCKRRVNDTGYLASLHRPNVELMLVAFFSFCSTLSCPKMQQFRILASD